MPRHHITETRLKELLNYDPDTGLFVWKKKQGRQKPGNIAGRLSAGYTQIQLDKCLYQAHWLAWFYVYGEWPSEEIDHKDGCKTNNAIENLRLATRLQNRQNHALNKRNASGCAGVSYDARCGKWYVRINKNKKSHYGGMWGSLEEAKEAYLKLRASLYEFQPSPRYLAVSG